MGGLKDVNEGQRGTQAGTQEGKKKIKDGTEAGQKGEEYKK
jgi:hypothetical protein